jgi:hypothetical protein
MIQISAGCLWSSESGYFVAAFYGFLKVNGRMSKPLENCTRFHPVRSGKQGFWSFDHLVIGFPDTGRSPVRGKNLKSVLTVWMWYLL